MTVKNMGKMTKKCVEIEGKTTKEAITAALKQLGVTRDMVTIQVLSEENKGLFGMEGAKLAKIKVMLKGPDNK